MDATLLDLEVGSQSAQEVDNQLVLEVACQSGREAVSPSGPVVVNQLILEAGKR